MVDFFKKLDDLNEPYLIAEIGINHNGDMDIAKKLIDATNACGWDCVKFQKRDPDLCVPKHQKQVLKETPWGVMSYINYKHKIEFQQKEYEIIDAYCQQKPIDWRYGVTGCEPKTYDLIYNYFDEFIFKVIIYYLYNLSEENFDQNIETLLNLLQNDRKGDYSIAINQIVTIVSDANFENNIQQNNIQETTIENYNASDQNNENNENSENSIDERLMKLKKLFEKELISEEEYKKKKEEILSEF